jgi:hypothetical protein
MKKMLILALIGLFYIGISALIPPSQVVVDNDVGYSIVINQNANVVTMPQIQNPVITGESSYLLVRGVSVPDKGLSNDTFYVNFKNQTFQMCRIDNYSQSWQRSVSTNLETPVKGINLFACDLGTWERYSKINVV